MINQCDGCRAGFPVEISAGGLKIHKVPYPLICQADRYNTMRIENIEFKITEADIWAGKAYSSKACPGALAMLRRLGPQVEEAAVDYGSVWVRWSLPNRPESSCGTPACLTDFIASFDKGDLVTPIVFSLTMEVPDDWAPGPLE